VGRSDASLLELLGRALGARVEGADGVDLVAPQLDAYRVATRREHVQDAPASTEQAGLVDDRRRLEAQAQPLGRQLGGRQAVATADGAVRGAERLGLDQQVRGGAHRGDHQGWPIGLGVEPRQALEHGQPIGELIGIVRQAVVRQRVRLGEQQHRVGLVDPGAQLVGVTPRISRTRDQQQHRPSQGLVERRHRVRPRRRDRGYARAAVHNSVEGGVLLKARQEALQAHGFYDLL
jgi:hypothetical protein